MVGGNLVMKHAAAVIFELSYKTVVSKGTRQDIVVFFKLSARRYPSKGSHTGKFRSCNK